MKKFLLPAVAAVLTVILLIIVVFVFILREEDTGTDTLQIFSWWTAVGEEEGLHELYRLYRKDYSDVEIVTVTIVGGSGYNARPVLESIMKGGKPPDAVQVLAGPGLIETWVKPGLLEPVTFLFEENNWMDVYPAEVLEKISFKEEIYAVPINIHRSNVLWYNAPIFERYGLSIPRSIEELIHTAEVLADNGETPLALGDKNTWPAYHILECVILSVLGADKYRGLWDGTTTWDSPVMAEALDRFMALVQYTNTDHAALTWDEAVQYVIDGKSAMIVIGDFAEAYFKAKGFRLKEDLGWCPFPGTESVFVMNSDTFVLPKGAKNRENAIRWLKLIGSREGQDLFNPKKGSIPARTDAEREKYDLYLQSSLEAFQRSEIVGSVTHGAAAPTSWQNELTRITRDLLLDHDIERALSALQRTADQFTGIH